jgi:4-hydroxy-tetrahydrodipicolinate reductase
VALAGWKGRMGAVLEPALRSADGVDLVARVEAGEDLTAACRAAKAQVVVDFTTPDSAAGNARAIARRAAAA